MSRAVPLWHIGLLLTLVTGVAMGLAFLDRPLPQPDSLLPLTQLRLLVGLPVLFLVPGLFLAPMVFGVELAVPGSEKGEKPLSLAWLLVGSFCLSTLLLPVNIILLRLAGLALSGPVLLGLLFAESLVGVGFLMNRARGTRVSFSTSGIGPALLLALCALGAYAASERNPLITDSSLFVLVSELEALAPVWTPADEPTELRFLNAWERGQRFRTTQSQLTTTIENRFPEAQRLQVGFLLHGPSGFDAHFQVEGVLASPSGSREDDRWVFAYQDWGTLLASTSVVVPAGQSTEVGLVFVPPANWVGPLPVSVVDLSGIDLDQVGGWLYDNRMVAEHSGGSAAEFHVLATQLGIPRGQPGFALFPTDLSVPPLASYTVAAGWYALSPRTATFSAQLLGYMTMAFLLCLAVLRERFGPLNPLLGVGLGLTAVLHLRAAILEVGLNFPDNLYAVGLAGAVLLASTARTRLLVGWTAVAVLSRYPGAVVVGLVLIARLLLQGAGQPDTRRHLKGLVATTMAFCGLMVLAALMSDRLGLWLATLWHETYYEHFEQNPGVPYLRRVETFCRTWAAFGGVALLLLVPLRGFLERLLLAALLLYAPMLMFIDHFALRYLFPLLWIGGVAVAARLQQLPGPFSRSAGMLVWAGMLLALLLTTPWVNY